MTFDPLVWDGRGPRKLSDTSGLTQLANGVVFYQGAARHMEETDLDGLTLGDVDPFGVETLVGEPDRVRRASQAEPGAPPPPAPPPPPPPAPGWNPADKSAVTTLSDANLHATVAFPTGPGGARSTTTQTTGKFYYEQKRNVRGDANLLGFGFANASASLIPNGPSADMVIWFQTSGYVAGPSGWLNLGAITTAADEWGAIAIDIAADKFWIRNAAGWDGDPAAGTGGYTLGITGPFYALFSTYAGAGGEGLTNLGGSAFAYAVPGGFSAWAP